MHANENSNNDEQWEIVSVKVDKDNKNRYLLYGYGDRLLMSVHEDLMVSYRLMKGSILPPELVDEVGNKDKQHQAYLLALRYLGIKPRTRNQLRQYLLRKELEEAYIEPALDRLENEKLVDDEEYARRFAASRMNSGLKGRLMIRQELQQRGVPKGIAADALAHMDSESELEAAVKLAHKKSRSLKGELYQRKQKLMAVLLRRGFPGRIAKEALKSVAWEAGHSPEEGEDGHMLDN